MTRLSLIAALFVFCASCTFDSRALPTCDEEGAVRAGAICSGGVWIAADSGVSVLDQNTSWSDGGSNTDVATPDLPAAPDAGPADMSPLEDMPADMASDASSDADVCVPESDEDFCDRLNLDCGLVSELDNCGTRRVDVDCGTCEGLDVCGGAGEANVCGCPDDATVCAQLAAECDTVDVSGMCSDRDSADCGGCTDPQLCGVGAAGPNQCGCDVTACDPYECGMRMVAGCSEVVDCEGCGSSQTCAPNGLCRCTDCNDAECFTGQVCAPGLVCQSDGSCDD